MSQVGTPASGESVRLGFVDLPAHVEVLHARFERYEFATHAHHTWSIGAVIAGAKDIAPRRRESRVASVGQLYALPPDEPHAGRSVADHCDYVMLYVPDDEWKAQCAAIGVEPGCLSAVGFRDASAAGRVATFVNRTLRRPREASAWSGEWDGFCHSLLHPYRGACKSAPTGTAARQDAGIVRAVDYLRTHWNRNVLLDELASEASMSTFEVCRRFGAAFGLTPHRYQLVLRVTNAKAQLLRGATPQDVALDTGFADQSHLGRHFKSVFGMTPGSVAKEAAAIRRFKKA